MSSIKDDIQFILENQTRSKMKEKLNQSIYSSNNNSQNNERYDSAQNQNQSESQKDEQKDPVYLYNPPPRHHGGSRRSLRSYDAGRGHFKASRAAFHRGRRKAGNRFEIKEYSYGIIQ